MARWIETDSLSNQDISSALEIGSYTADAEKTIRAQIFADQVAGDDDYLYWITLQVAGAGSAYKSMVTTETVASGVTSIFGQSADVDMKDTDVLKVYILGAAGDTTTPDTVVRFFNASDDVLTPLAVVDGNVDDIETILGTPANFKATGFATPTNITAGTITTATNVTNLPAMAADWITASGLKADAVTEIQSGLAATTDLTSSSDVWTYGSRTLTQSASSIISAVTGDSITDIRGSSWGIEVEDLTLDANKQQFTIKKSRDDADASALLMIDDTGLVYLNGAAGTSGDGSLSYTGTTLTITVKASATAQLPKGTYVYNIQYVTAAGVVEEPYGGKFVITPDGVRAVT